MSVKCFHLRMDAVAKLGKLINVIYINNQMEDILIIQQIQMDLILEQAFQSHGLTQHHKQQFTIIFFAKYLLHVLLASVPVVHHCPTVFYQVIYLQ